MNFASDNIVGVDPRILDAMQAVNDGPTAAYGADQHTGAALAKLADAFGTDIHAFPMVTGTATNGLCLSTLTPPYGAVLCHRDAHVNTDECGHPEMMTGGAKVIGLQSLDGKLTPDLLRPHLEPTRGVHSALPTTISLTNATEVGTAYSPDEVAAICELAHAHDMRVHVDGARLANALVHLGCELADLTWRAGVDAVSFGGTKNGGMTIEVAVLFDDDLARGVDRRRMKMGQLQSKGRYLGAQLGRYLDDDVWLANARHANAMARRLRDGLADVPGVTLPLATQANELFPALPRQLSAALHDEGAVFYEWLTDLPPQLGGPQQILARLVCAFTTTPEEVDAFVSTAARLAAGPARAATVQ